MAIDPQTLILCPLVDEWRLLSGAFANGTPLNRLTIPGSTPFISRTGASWWRRETF
jgi:hypothetical protein